jgi:hypothetical protein
LTSTEQTIAERVAALEPYRVTLESRETLRRSADGNIWHYLADAGDIITICGAVVDTTRSYSVPFADVASDVHDCDRCREILESFTPAPRRLTFSEFEGTFAIGTGTGDASIGRNAINSYRHGLPYPWSTVEAVDIIAAWSEAWNAYNADLAMVGRTLRAAARSRGWGHHYGDAMSRLDIVHPVMRPTFEAPTAVPARRSADGPTMAERYRSHTPPTLPLPSDAAMAELLDGAANVLRRHTQELDDIATAFHDKAVECGWCGEYEQTVERLNGELSASAGEPFIARNLERDWNVSGTVTITVSIPVSTMVTASDEEQAGDYGYDSLRDSFSLVDELANHVTYQTARDLASSWSYDVDDVTVDEVYED